MKIKSILLTIIMAVSGAAFVFAAGGESHHGSPGAAMNEDKLLDDAQQKEPVDAGNTICPVSGGKIGEMGPGVQYEHEGKIYHFCCAGCIDEFKKDPVKYIKIIEEQKEHEALLGEEK